MGLRGLRDSFVTTFGKLVRFVESFSEPCIKELYDYCGMGESAFHVEPLQMARLEGRREVFLYIQHMLKLTDDDIDKMNQNIKENMSNE